jgi:hypothetical protein
MRTARQALVPLAAVLSATATAACYDPGLSSSLAPASAPHGSVEYVIDQAQLQQSANGTLLASIAARVSGLAVRHAGSECPQITLRGPKRLVGNVDPGIYVDGERAANTCVLEMLNVGDVQRVEVYPMGVTQRAGYEAQAGGLILVFMRDGNS